MNAFEKKLADLIREHPNLYDQTRRDYKDTLRAHVSWKHVAEAMGKSEEAVKLKWKNLRDKFCKAKKRMVRRNPASLAEDESPLERPVPVLYHQLAWLNAYVKPRAVCGVADSDEVAGSGDDLEKERDKDEQEQNCTLPVVSTSFSVPTSHDDGGAIVKRKRQTTDTELSAADGLTILRDEDELFLLSLLPSLKRLTIKKRMEVRMKFQQVLYAAEFED